MTGDRLIVLAAVCALLLAACSPATPAAAPTAPSTRSAAEAEPTAPVEPTAGGEPVTGQEPTSGPTAGAEPGAIPPPGEDLARIDEQGAIVVVVTPLNLGSDDATLDFQVALDTHSIELNFDLAAVATLSSDDGREVAPLSWDPSGGGHHVSGTLSFPAAGEDGRPLVEGASRLTLTIVGVDAPARTFVWELAK